MTFASGLEYSGSPNFGKIEPNAVTAVKSDGGSPFPGGLDAPLHQEYVLGTPAGNPSLYPGVFWAIISSDGGAALTSSGGVRASLARAGSYLMRQKISAIPMGNDDCCAMGRRTEGGMRRTCS